MAEYIERGELLTRLTKMEGYNVSPMYRRGYDDCITAVQNAPTAMDRYISVERLKEEHREERVSKILAALDACAGRSCGHRPCTTPRTAACERMVKADAAALIRELRGEIEQKNREE